MHNHRNLTYGFLAAVVPFGLMSAYLYFTRIRRPFSTDLDLPALVASLFVGLIFVARTNFPRDSRPVLFVFYAAVGFIALFGYSLIFVCGIFKDCL